MMKRWGAGFLTVTVLLAGCSMAPEYKRPETPVAGQWPQGEAYKNQPATAPSGEQSAANLGYTAFFQSEPMQKVIATALENNRDLRVAALNIEAARAAYRIQRADLLPTVGVNGAYTRNAIPENGLGIGGGGLGGGFIVNNTSLNVGVTAFELDLFGRVRSLSEAALQDYLATEEAARAVQVSLIAETANAYLTYLADRKLLDITNQTLKTQQDAYTLIQKRFESGIGTQQDVSQAATTVETARANQSVYQRAMAQDKNALELLAGSPLDDAMLNQITLDDVKVMDNLPVGLPSETLLARPDIRQAERQLMAANANIGAARAAFFPNISLTAAVGLASQDLKDLFDSGSRPAWNYSPNVSLPIFNGGRNIAGLKNAKVQRDIAVATYEKSIQTAFREVADELAARGTYTDQLKAQQDLVAATKKSYDISQARYTQGIDNYLVTLDAQRSLYAAQQNEILVAQQRLANLVNMYKVLGGGQ